MLASFPGYVYPQEPGNEAINIPLCYIDSGMHESQIWSVQKYQLSIIFGSFLLVSLNVLPYLDDFYILSSKTVKHAHRSGTTLTTVIAECAQFYCLSDIKIQNSTKF